MLRKRKALKEYGADFIVGFSGLMNGEKDPRNLMLAFSIMKVIITEFHIVSQVVDLFDVVYCYFPITFRPPKDEPSAITTEDLKLRLRECLSANHQFAPYLVPALIEKLNAVALSVKKDTLQTIAACCRNWSGRTLDTYANQIWNSIKYEISLSEDPEVESAALEVVTAITASFGKGLSEMSKNSDLSRWLQPIIVEAVEQLKEPELKNARSCGKTLKACSIAGPLAFDVVSHATVPGLLAICEETDNINRKTSLIEILIHILDAATLVYGSIADTVLAGSDCALVFVKDEILALLSKNLFGTPKVEGEFRKLALRGLVKALYVQKFLNEKEREMIVRYLGDILVEESGEMAEEALKALIGITPVRPGAILENTFPTLLSRLPEQCLDTGSTKLANLVLSALARLSVERSTFDTLIVRLFSRLDSSLSHNDGDSNLPKALLSTLLQVTRKKSEDDPKGLAKYYDRIVPAIFQRTIGSLSFDGSKAMVQPEILEINAEIVNLVTRVCEPEQQRDYAADVFSLYVTGGMNGLVKHLSDDFKPFDPQASEYQRNTIVLFVALYAALSRDIPIASVPNVAFLSRIIDFGNAASNGGQRLAARRLIALILNKCASESELSDLLSPSAGLFPPSTDRIKSSSLHTMIWVAKALVLRNHKDSRNLVLRLVDLLPDPEFGREAAESIETLIGDDMMLSKENHAVVKLLHRQKFFAYCVPDLMQRMGLVRSDLRTNYLVALSLIVGSVPKEVYMTEAATLLPVLIQCLESPESRLKISACNTLLVILVESKDLVAQHLSSLVPLLLASLRVSEVSTPVIVFALLHC